MLCDNCVLVLLLLKGILPLCFRTLILICTDAYRIYVRVFLSCVYICHSSVSVPAELERYKDDFKRIQRLQALQVGNCIRL